MYKSIGLGLCYNSRMELLARRAKYFVSYSQLTLELQS